MARDFISPVNCPGVDAMSASAAAPSCESESNVHKHFTPLDKVKAEEKQAQADTDKVKPNE